MKTSAALLGAFLLLPATAGAGEGRITVHPFPLGEVRLLAGPFTEARARTRAYLLDLEADRLLHTFRLNAGLPSTAVPLGGWEGPNVELRGHFLGHYLSACAAMYAGAGDTVLKVKADRIVSELGEVQRALGNGFLSAFPESFVERVETGRGVWAPWYTLHKIMAGLLDMYRLAGNAEALVILKRFAEWAKQRTDRLDSAAMQRMLRTEFGGMNDVLRELYRTTRDPAHLGLARRFDHASVLDPLALREDRLTGLHANTQIPKIIGSAVEYEISGSLRHRTIAEFFWEEVLRARTYVSGGTSHDEHWGMEPYRLATHIGQYDHETCCTYNMLKLTSRLFGWQPQARYADYYERALWNGILGVQNPDDGMTMYYVPMGTGWFKTFGTKRESFWCCTGTGIELFSTLQQNIFFRGKEELYVNLFVPSQLTWTEKGVTIRQETRFPEESGTRLTVRTARPVRFTLQLRVPEWTAEGGYVAVNGQRIEAFAARGSYITLRRSWKDGDRVELRLPMELRVERMPDNLNRCAILYGPVLLAGDLGPAGVPDSAVSGPYGPQGDPVAASHLVVPATDPAAWIVPLEGSPLTFRTTGAGRPADVTLVPFFRLFGRRYAIYWDLYERREWEGLVTQGSSVAPGAGDRMRAGDSISERAHDLSGFRITRGETGGRTWISCADWFRFDLALPFGRPAALGVTLTEADSGRDYIVTLDGWRLIDIVGETRLQGGLKEVVFRIPEEAAAGKKEVGVIFRVPRGERSRKLFECRVVPL